MAVDWTTSYNDVLDLTEYKTYPSNITAQIEKYLKDKEDQLTATWKPLTKEDTSKCMLPTLEQCLISTVRFGDNTDMELYELSILDHSASGLQPNTIEGKVHPIITVSLSTRKPVLKPLTRIFYEAIGSYSRRNHAKGNQPPGKLSTTKKEVLCRLHLAPKKHS